MGWLRQTWQRAGCSSANELAELLLAHELVPTELPIKPSSLANNLRSLDRGKRLGWWRRHRALLAPLASVLDRTPDELEQLLAEPASSDGARDDEPARIPLALLGRLRSLDPSAEELPSGFPELVSRPGRWRRTWWTTLDRRARQIAGRWLEARGLARYLTATSLADARAKLPDEGRVFLELTTRVDADDLVAFAEARELDGLRVCVAAPFHWRSKWAPAPGTTFRCPVREDTGPWADVDLAPLEDELESLTSWAAERIPRARRPDRAALMNHVRGLDPALAFSGPGDVLDFVGLWAATPERARPTVGDRRAWARLRISAGFSASADAAPSHADADEVVRALLSGALRSDHTSWLYGQPRTAWRALLPDGLADADTLRELLGEAETGLSAERVEQLRAALAPSPQRTLDSLAQAGILVPTGETDAGIDPCWAVNILYRDALDHLLDGDARDVGNLVLQEHLVDAIIERLLESFVKGDLRRARRLLADAKRSTTDARVLAAYEVSACAFGLACLVLADPPADLVELTRAGLRQALVVLDGVPAGLVVPLSGRNASLCELPVVVLAALALNVAGGQGEDLKGREGTERLCDLASPSIRRLRRLSSGPQLIRGAFLLGAEITPPLEKNGQVRTKDELRLPMRMYEAGPAWRSATAFVRGMLKIRRQSYLTKLHLDPRDLFLGIEAVSARANGTPSSLFEILWEIWADADERDAMPPLRWLAEDPEAAEYIWRHGSPASQKPFLLALLNKRAFPACVARALAPDGWRAWIKLILEGETPQMSPYNYESWSLLPPEVAREFVANSRIQELLHKALIDALWAAAPDDVIEFVRAAPTRHALCFCIHAPSERLTSILPSAESHLEQLGELSDDERARVVRWLGRMITGRLPGWRRVVKLRRRYLTGWAGLAAR